MPVPKNAEIAPIQNPARAAYGAFPAFTGAISVPGLVLLTVGGGLYSLGVVFHLWRRLPYQNAIWHAFVLAAAACHFSAVLSEVALAR